MDVVSQGRSLIIQGWDLKSPTEVKQRISTHIPKDLSTEVGVIRNMETSHIHVETISEPEPEPLSTEDKLWRNHTEYQIINYIIAHIDICDLLMLDYLKNELNVYSSGSEISTIRRMVYIKMESIMKNQKTGSLMNEIYSHSLRHRHIIPIDYSSKEIQEFIKFIDYDKEIKSNFDFDRLQQLNKQLFAHIIYEKKKKDEIYRKMREEENQERERIEKQEKQYGKKPTCRIS